MINKLNIYELAKRNKELGYDDEYAEAKLCQDIILLLISKSKYVHCITIKGGVAMRNIAGNMRRTTLDIDFDFIGHSINDNSIKRFIDDLNGIEGIFLKIIGSPERLRHQDYYGKRVHLSIEDSFNNKLFCKIDIGVHKYINLEQDDYCFDLSFNNEGISLLINSKEQIFAEKIKTILRFGPFSTRYKDIYDIFYLIKCVNKDRLVKAFDVLIFNDELRKERSIIDITERLEKTFSNKHFLNRLLKANRNWIGKDDKMILEDIIRFLKSLI
ncbi:MAG: nucleotidyl transferase AbiEii/AbiGii toxin family protein [Bacilli bacterium]|nr:nucleotidyl transferase AbiEii/AbiGii toxin family protein [Bacilli bacterium]